MNYTKKLKLKFSNIFEHKITFNDLSLKDVVFLYAGDVPKKEEYKNYIGLSLSQSNKRHINHNILNDYPINDGSVDKYQSEDVFEHIDLDMLPKVINEIHRVLKKGGLFRLSLPDYKCDILSKRSTKNELGNIIFDPLGGGNFINEKVMNGGHLWFPTYEIVKELLSKTKFSNIKFLHYYDENGNGITNKIDYSLGYVMRTPDNDKRVKSPFRPMSIVVDCIK